MAVKHGHVSVELLDNLGVTTSCPIYVSVDDSKTLSAITADVLSIAAAIDGASDSKISQTSFKVLTGIPGGAKSVPAATAENERTGLFNFSQSFGPYKFGVDIPGIKDAAIVGGKIDLSNADISNLVNALSVAYATMFPESTSFYALVALLDALISFRKHRKAESRRSFEVG